MSVRTAAVAAGLLAVASVAACGGSGSLASRFEDAPEHPGEPWSKDGTRVAESVLQLAEGAEHCGWQDSAFLGGTALGYGDDPTRSVWSRDPDGVISERTRAGFRADAELPEDAVFTGWSQGPVELWTAPSDRREYVSLVHSEDPDDVERWVAGGGGCA